MKITAEFNSVEEVLNFASTFGGTSLIEKQEIVQAPTIKSPEGKHEEGKIEKVASKDKNESKEDKVETKVEGKKVEPPKENESDDSKKEDPKSETPKVTKEMIRDRLGSIMKSGKQKEVKELVAKYGAKKVPELKEEDYPAIYKEAEGLM